MAAYFSTVHPSKVKSMEALILFDYKDYNYSCEACGWSGNEVELDVVTKISMNLVCCPDCKNDDVRVLGENEMVTL